MENTSANRKIETLSVEKAKEWVTGKAEGVLLDVRQPEEYKAGHLPGAVFIPLPDLVDKVGELDPAMAVLTYCRSGNRSRAAAAFLLSEGFSKVYNMEGGITAWNGQAATGSYDEGLYLLNGRETAEELISLALVLEDGSRMFYESISELTTDAEVRNTLAALAEAEARHKTTIIEAYRLVTGRDLNGRMADEEPVKGVMEGGGRIEDVIAFLKGEDKTLLDILEVSMQVETNALDLYIKILRRIEDVNAKKVFDILIKEEKHHLSRLGKLLAEKVA